MLKKLTARRRDDPILKPPLHKMDNGLPGRLGITSHYSRGFTPLRNEASPLPLE